MKKLLFTLFLISIFALSTSFAFAQVEREWDAPHGDPNGGPVVGSSGAPFPGSPPGQVGPNNAAPGPNSYPAQSPGGVQGTYDPDTHNFYPTAEPVGPQAPAFPPPPVATPPPVPPPAPPVPTTPPNVPLPTDTPVPTSPPALCPNGTCDSGSGETCSTCPYDCGVCTPPPPSNLCTTYNCTAQGLAYGCYGGNRQQPPSGCFSTDITTDPNYSVMSDVYCQRCTAPPACNSSCASNADCANIPGGCNACLPNGAGGKSCQNPPACNSACSSNADCANLPGGCNQCLPNAAGGKSCQNPPACNSACSSNADCANLPGGCNACLPNGAGGKSCQNPPACNSACSSNADCANLPGGCNACLPNGAGGNTCQPPVACNTACSKDADCAGAKDGCTACVAGANGSKTCKPPVACNSACTKDSDCNSGNALRDGCNACLPNAAGGNTCQAPKACNSACTKDADCNSGDALKNGCTSCLPGANGQKVCKPPMACNSVCTKDADCNSGNAVKDGCNSCVPGANGVNTCQKPAACNSACTKDSDCNNGAALKDGCTSCIGGSCSQFSTDMCKCDGIESSPLAAGEKVSVSNFEKVEGGDTKSAKVKDMTFYLTQDDKIISKSSPIAASVESSSAEKVRYKSTWDVQIPADANPNSDYRIFAQVNCVKKEPLAYSQAPNRVVLGEATTPQNQNIFSAIASFFSRLFGGQTVTPSQVVGPTATPKVSPSGNNPLQMGKFSPGTIIEKSCRFIRFKFK